MPAATKRRSADLIIETTDDIARGCRALRRRCTYMRKIHNALGDPPLRRRQAGFAGLARIVVGQQLSIASADAIWARVQSELAPFEPATLLSVGETQLRDLGLSRPKMRTLRAVASASVNGDICFDELSTISEPEVRQRLTNLHGIGPWSADIYMMFCLGARDAFAPGDLALQEAVRMVMHLPARPDLHELEEIAQRWRPWRAIAARLLWADYANRRAQT